MCKYALKLLPWPNILLGGILLALLPLVISLRFLDFTRVALIGEGSLPVLGIVLLTPLAFCEGEGRREVLACRVVPYWRGFAVRLSAMVLLVLCAAGIFVAWAQAQANALDAAALWMGLSITMLSVGVMGLTVGHLTSNQAMSYLIPFGFFILEFYTRGRFTGRFFLLSLIEGTLRPEKFIWLGVAAALLLINIPLSLRQVKV